jgi:hypothetical protein
MRSEINLNFNLTKTSVKFLGDLQPLRRRITLEGLLPGQKWPGFLVIGNT